MANAKPWGIVEEDSRIVWPEPLPTMQEDCTQQGPPGGELMNSAYGLDTGRYALLHFHPALALSLLLAAADEAAGGKVQEEEEDAPDRAAEAWNHEGAQGGKRALDAIADAIESVHHFRRLVHLKLRIRQELLQSGVGNPGGSGVKCRLLCGQSRFRTGQFGAKLRDLYVADFVHLGRDLLALGGSESDASSADSDVADDADEEEKLKEKDEETSTAFIQRRLLAGVRGEEDDEELDYGNEGGRHDHCHSEQGHCGLCLSQNICWYCIGRLSCHLTDLALDALESDDSVDDAAHVCGEATESHEEPRGEAGDDGNSDDLKEEGLLGHGHGRGN